ncbi:transglycosylase domain-containing protein [Aestuariimicrobium sp. T2.26MG-19.2B]|uniref:transglycosylase domain-containing protein n=1 Tax=Aestuariimicrobium sp. T2.26MG-19.2B TaxID=3040679 RepID=UPI002477887B|nr:transglycosylase domain-containing protein [Aestuariimicrobium sp. T2.26MG-19.2B]CAI9404708.1 Penicillin-binding protein 1A [Aestuariimicrobium sp. T2.26MG-19.2B]
MSATKASKAYALAMFAAVSVLCGLLTAGLAVPYVAMAGGVAKAGANSLEDLPAALDIPPQSEVSRVLMANGEVLATFYDQNREYVAMSKIHPYMQEAQVAIEDHRFFEHGAIDLQGTLRAFVRNSTGGATQGGSTLTQQYVKQVLVQDAQNNNDEEAMREAQAQTVSRKVRELRYAIALEKSLGPNAKKIILERYLNIAYYGDGAYGVQAASKRFFNTTADKLTLAQAAMLAGLVQNPNATNPRLYPQAAMNRRNVVLQRMADLGVVTQAEADAAKKSVFEPAKVQPAPNGCISSPFPHVCDYVRRVLLSDAMPSLGKTADERDRNLKRGGLTIQTLIDPKTQRAAQSAISDLVSPTDPVISTSVLVQPRSGLIVAMAQSRPKMGTGRGETFLNYNVEKSMGDASGFQGGSTFKAFGIAAALEKGMTPNTKMLAKSTVDMTGVSFMSCQGMIRQIQPYKVSNSVSGYGNRQLTLVQAAQGSVNTFFVPLAAQVGNCAVTQMADRAGAKLANGQPMTTQSANLSFILGSAEVTPMSMAQAYATFANRGVRCNPLILKSVTTKAGKSLGVPAAKCQKVMEASIADGTNYVLSKVMEYPGTGYRARIPGDYPQAGKTGTTESNEAVWFAGYTPEMAGIAMISVDKGTSYWANRKRSLKGIRLPSGTYLEGSGSGDAGRIYKVAMAEALKGKPKTKFVAPTDEVLNGKEVQIPDLTGLTLQEAEDAVRKVGLNPVERYQYDYRSVGTWIDTYPTGKTRVGQPVYFVLSSGPRPQPKPQPKPTATATSSSSASKPPSSSKPTATATATASKPGKKKP